MSAVPAHNLRLQRTLMDKVPKLVRQRVNAETELYAAAQSVATAPGRQK
jgi:hypothetical protein